MRDDRRPTRPFPSRWLFPALALLWLCAGCAAIVAGGVAAAGTVVWVKGNLKEVLEHPVPKVQAAAVATLKEMGMPVRESKGDALSARVNSQFSDGTEVWIGVDSVDEDLSELSIRVGVTGDRYRSERILEGIHKKL